MDVQWKNENPHLWNSTVWILLNIMGLIAYSIVWKYTFDYYGKWKSIVFDCICNKDSYTYILQVLPVVRLDNEHPDWISVVQLS